LEQQGLEVNRNNYVIVHTEPLTPDTTLDDIHQKFNIDPPADFSGHSLSVSDVVVLNKNSEITSHYVDKFGFSELPAFLGIEKQQEQTAPAVEQGGNEPPAPPNEPPTAEPPEVPKSEQPLYKQSVDYAKENGEIQAWRDSYKLNVECGVSLDKAVIDNNYELYRYDLNSAIRGVVDEYGTDRVAWVLASQVNDQSYDGRLSNASKDWAKGFDTPKPDVYLKSHMTLIEGLVDKFRKIEKEKPSLMSALNAGEKKSKTEFDNKAKTGLEAPEKSTQKNNKEER
jgi:hypothetical protein